MNAAAAPFAQSLGHAMPLADWWTRKVFLAVAAVLSVLVVATGIWAFVTPHCCAPPRPTSDFAWLTTAMRDCDADAARQTSTLYFLVIPMASKPEDEQQWRAKSRD